MSMYNYYYSTVELITHLFCPLQLIYDFKDGGGSLGLISLNPNGIPKEDISEFSKIGVEIPSMK